MSIDISATTVPDSTQWNADDLQAAERTVTVASVTAGTTEQPININLVETPDRAYRPGKSMRRVLVAAWGSNSDDYIGRKITMFCDPTIKFGRDIPGGIRIRALSHIEKPLTVALTVTRGKRAPFTVQPITDADAAPTIAPATPEEVQACTEVAELRAMWATATPEVQTLITARKAELDATAPAEGDES